MAGVPTVRHSVAPNSAPPGAPLEQIFILLHIILLLKKHTQQNLYIFGFTNKLFFCACIAIHSKRTFSLKENFFKMIRDESHCDLSSEEDELNEK